jgi:hypothetical protein
MGMKDIDYIHAKYVVKKFVSPEFSTRYYLVLSFLIALFPTSMLFVYVKNLIIPNMIKINTNGIFLSKNLHTKKSFMLKYLDIDSCSVDNEKTVLSYKQDKIIISSDCFDSEYKYNEFSTFLYSNYRATKQNV